MKLERCEKISRFGVKRGNDFRELMGSGKEEDKVEEGESKETME